MKIDKAIELLQEEIKNPDEPPWGDIRDAIKLAIEALKRIKDRRAIMLSWEDTPLPDETPEEDRHADH